MENQFPLKFKVNLIGVKDNNFYENSFEQEEELYEVAGIWFQGNEISHLVIRVGDEVETLFPEKVEFELFQMVSSNDDFTLCQYIMVWTNSDRDYTGLDGEDKINLEVMS